MQTSSLSLSLLLSTVGVLALAGCTADDHRAPSDKDGTVDSQVTPDDDTGSNAFDIPADDAVIATHTVSPSALVFTGRGETSVLTAETLWSDGQAVPSEGRISWESSDPDQVSIDEDGVVTSLVDVGSAVITATIDGRPSQPVVVVVARPADQTRMLSDDDFDRDPQELHDRGELMWRVHVNPALGISVGERLVGTGSRAIMGEVVGVDDDGGELEVAYRQLDEVFDEFDIDVAIPLHAAVPQAPQAAADTGWEWVPDGEGSWTLIPPEGATGPDGPPPPGIESGEVGEVTVTHEMGNCKLEGSISSGFTPTIEKPTIKPSVDFEFHVDGDPITGMTVHRIALTGTLTYTSAVGIRGSASAAGNVTCEVDIGKMPIRAGVLSLANPHIPLGVGASVDVNAGMSDLVHLARATYAPSVTLGVQRSGDRLEKIPLRSPSREMELEIESNIEEWATDGVRLEVTAEAYLKTGFNVGYFDERATLELVESKLGLRAELELASRRTQANDPNARSSYETDLFATLAPGSSVNSAMEVLGIDGLIDQSDLEAELLVDIGGSPHGSVTLEGEIAEGETVWVHIDITEQVSFLWQDVNVKTIQVVRLERNEAGTVVGAEVVEEIDPGDWPEATWEHEVTAQDIEERAEYAFFLKPKFLSVPLEVTEDSTIQLDPCGSAASILRGGSFESTEDREAWTARGGAWATDTHLPWPAGFGAVDYQPTDGDHAFAIGTYDGAFYNYGSIEQRLGEVTAEAYELQGSYAVMVEGHEFFYTPEVCASLDSAPAFTVMIHDAEGTLGSTSLSPAEYYCDSIIWDSSRGNAGSYDAVGTGVDGEEGMMSLPGGGIRIPVDRESDNAYLRLVAYAPFALDHIVLLDDLSLIPLNEDCTDDSELP